MADNQPTEFSINCDRTKTPILYTDSVYVLTNEHGVVLDFAQSVGPAPQQFIVSSMGMTREQAKQLIQTMKDTLGIE